MQDDIIIEELIGKNGAVGRIILNRPTALNALSENMCNIIHINLEKWGNDPNVKLVIIKGAGEKAFCAGGDIRQIHEQKGKPLVEPQPFFSAEYSMNHALFHFKKPYFALLNGITMGGGIGVSIHGSYRIATEKLRLAMPETAIGFYPDVGAAYHLVRRPKKFGWYLGLTGTTIGAADALHFGFCTHFVPSEKISDLENALIETADKYVITEFAEQKVNPEFQEHEDLIEDCFNVNSIDEAIEKLGKNGSAFAKSTLEIFQKRSPMSLKVTWEHLKRCEKLSFDEIIQQDYLLTLHFLKAHDFYEGVRAQIIDKDKNPRWIPGDLREVTNTAVNSYFERNNFIPLTLTLSHKGRGDN